MPRRRLLVSLAAVLVATGCGTNFLGGPTVAPVSEASELHGGILVPLSEDQGYVELLNGERQRRSSKTTIVAYLLQNDRKTPATQKPTDFIVKLGGDPVPLHPAQDAHDPAGSVRFVSGIGAYELNQQGGEVTVTLDGKTSSGTFRGPR